MKVHEMVGALVGMTGTIEVVLITIKDGLVVAEATSRAVYFDPDLNKVVVTGMTSAAEWGP